jgi:hypothetical protein
LKKYSDVDGLQCILEFSAFYHDSAAALPAGREVNSASQEEHFGKPYTDLLVLVPQCDASSAKSKAVS